MFNHFANIPSIYLIYLFYGAAFFFLGITIVMKDMRSSDLKLARSLWLLGLFGFTHGVHEWLQIYPLLEGEHLAVRDIYQVKAVALGLLFVSFFCLVQFGSALIRATHTRRMGWLSWLPAALLILWVAYIEHRGFTMDLQFLRQASIGLRHTFGLAGGLLTAYGLVAYSREIRHLSRFVSDKFYYAGITFGFYAVVAGVLSSDFAPFLPVPVEVFRGLSAILIAYLIIKALNIFDVEMREKIEQQARRLVQTEKLASLGQLAAGIAHEINNPLTNASLAIQMLKTRLKADGCSVDGAIEKLNAVERNIDRASVIARELLQFSRQRDEEFSLFNINSVIHGTLTLLQYKLKDIVVRQNLADSPEVKGDPGKLEQVFINILSNSREAMPRGGVITISTEQGGGQVRVKITDTGIGIPEKKLSRVFDPFFTTKEIGMGTGLGLSICYGIVQRHRGTIEISSREGKGTTVLIILPAGGVK